MRKWLASVLIGSVMATVSFSGYADMELTIYLNDEAVIYDDFFGHPFVDANYRTQVPIRLTLETFGAVVTWDDATKTATATKGGITLKVPLNEQYFYLNDTLVWHDTMPVALEGRIYMPIRAIMEAFGAEVLWDGDTWSVYVNYNDIVMLPQAFDLRAGNQVSTVKDQGEIGACWAFASIGAIESVLLPEAALDLSEDHLSLAHGYDLTQNDGGDYHVAMSYFAGWKGPILESEDPYGDHVFTTGVEPSVYVQEIQILPEKDFRSIKEHILTVGAVESTLYLDYDLFDGDTDYYDIESAAYYYNGRQISNHDVLIVGWDDNYSRSNFNMVPPIDGAFICKNSYGRTFGDRGYFYVSYADTNIALLNVSYSKVTTERPYDHNYQTDDLGWVGTVGYGTETAYMGNVYSPGSQQERLAAVGFYATGEQTDYEVYLVKAFQTMSDLSKMKFMTSGHLDNKGYYTVEFDSPVLISGQFAVIVKITTLDSERPVAVEINKNIPWLGDVVIDDGYGIISADGVSWSRTEDLVDANVCLKAFTLDLE